MILSKQEAIMRLCALAQAVNAKNYGYSEDVECFCGERRWLHFYSSDCKVSSEVIEFIEQTVHDKLQGNTELKSDDHKAFFEALDNPAGPTDKLVETKTNKGETES